PQSEAVEASTLKCGGLEGASWPLHACGSGLLRAHQPSIPGRTDSCNYGHGRALWLSPRLAVRMKEQSNNGLELTSASANGLQRSQLNPVFDGRRYRVVDRE